MKKAIEEKLWSYVEVKKEEIEYHAICAYALRVLCGMGYMEMCRNINSMTVSECSKLCSQGYQLIKGNSHYEKLFNELSECIS